jgi:hypothetical protein
MSADCGSEGRGFEPRRSPSRRAREERADETLKTRSRVSITAIDNAISPCPPDLPQTRFSGADDRLGSVGDLQLGEDVRDVVAHGLRAEGELPGDRGVGMALGYELKDLTLSVG